MNDSQNILKRPSLLSIFNTDSTNKSSLKKESVDLTITSPPYNLGKLYNGSAEGDSMNYKVLSFVYEKMA